MLTGNINCEDIYKYLNHSESDICTVAEWYGWTIFGCSRNYCYSVVGCPPEDSIIYKALSTKKKRTAKRDGIPIPNYSFDWTELRELEFEISKRGLVEKYLSELEKVCLELKIERVELIDKSIKFEAILRMIKNG